MNEPLISVIVPVYNVKQYIERCVDSILVQTYTNIEIILVDDGSTDGSGNLCDTYAGKDARVQVVHKDNGGLSDARNAGIQAAKGEYYAFVDSDDYVAADYIAYLYNLLDVKLNKDRMQISICGYRKVYGSRINAKDSADHTAGTIRAYDSEEGLFHLLYQKEMISSAWGRLFQAELFREIRFPKGRLHEDVAVIYKLFDAADKIICGSEEKYYYFQRSDSIVNMGFDRRRMDYILFTDECIRYMQDNHPELRKAAVSRHFSACFDLLSCMGKQKSENAEEYGILVSEIKKYRKTVLSDPNARLKNRLAAAGSYISIAGVQELSRLIRN